MKNSTVTFESKSYILMQDPFCDCLPSESPYFLAVACPAKIWGTEAGNDPMNWVTVIWDVIPGTEDDWDDSNKCDWAHPSRIRR